MAVDFAAGFLGGCAGLAVGYPLDTIKVHIQTQNMGNPQFRGTWHCFQCILAKDSIRGFYRGMSSPIAGVAFVNAIVFGIYGQAQKYSKNPENLSSHFLAGAAAGLAQSPVVAPLELIKTKLQLQESNGKKKYSGPINCLCKIYRQSGILGIFRGLNVTAVREVPGYGLYFFTYEALTRNNSLIKINQPISTLHMLLAGGLSGIVSWVFTYPIDVIKSRLQADKNSRYVGAIDCLKKSLNEEGVGCLFKGLNSTILRAFPTNAATFTVVNWTIRLCGDKPRTFNDECDDNTNKYNDNDTHPIIIQRNSTINDQQRLMFNNYNSLFRSVLYYDTPSIESYYLVDVFRRCYGNSLARQFVDGHENKKNVIEKNE
ncbi:hypothetical protein PV325_010349 [Microctonus aethiopoides]|nr:hypothetical protein PV325_010349 [Microctonus aethiopoides]